MHSTQELQNPPMRRKFKWHIYCSLVACPVELRDDSEGGIGNIADELIKHGLVTATSTDQVQYV